MTFAAWASTFFEEIKSTSRLEWLGVVFGVVEVLLARVNNILLYPAGIISVIATVIVYYNSSLYAESLLNAYYLVMSIYGWMIWIRRRHEPLSITKATREDWFITSGITIGGFAFLAFALHRWTSSTVPYWDAWVSATAWAGMWLLAKRKLENWLLLNISNAFAIPLLVYKHLPMYALLTVVLFIVAVQGYYTWRKLLRTAPAYI